MRIFPTVSFHPVKPCNMSCKYCFATFADFKVKKQLTLSQSMLIIYKLRMAGVEKITFAGGEPMIYAHLDECIKYAKELNMTTSIITNGAMVTHKWMKRMQYHLDWFGVSIDSLNPYINQKIGRVHKNIPMDGVDYRFLVNMCRQYGFKLKINTVVNAYNQQEDMQSFIDWANPDRWKVFDALRVVGQNDEHWDEIKSSIFDQFVARHSHPNMVVESNELMTSSYLLIDPLGRFFDDTKGTHTYSDSLVDYSVEHCLSQISINESVFLERGGIYNWS